MSNVRQSLIQLTCSTKKTTITVYADLFVCAGNIVCAARYAGEPEQVQAMTACMGAGATICCDGKDDFKCKSNQEHYKNVMRNGKYAEGLYYVKDDPISTRSLQEQGEEKQQSESKRNIYLFCSQKEDLFEELNRKVAVPMLPEFQEYILSELAQQGLLHEMTVFSPHYPLFGWYLTVSNDEKELVEILNRGLKDGRIQIPGGHPGMSGVLQKISTFTAYLKEFGVQIADKIKKRFCPIYDPVQEKVCPEILDVNNHVIQEAGYSLFDAQLGTAEAIKRQLDRDKLALLIAECGTGKPKSALQPCMPTSTPMVHPKNISMSFVVQVTFATSGYGKLQKHFPIPLRQLYGALQTSTISTATIRSINRMSTAWCRKNKPATAQCSTRQ